MITETTVQVRNSPEASQASLGTGGLMTDGNHEIAVWIWPWFPIPLTERGQRDPSADGSDDDEDDDEELRFAAELGRRAWRRQAQSE
jgi:hypothetical protein